MLPRGIAQPRPEGWQTTGSPIQNITLIDQKCPQKKELYMKSTGERERVQQSKLLDWLDKSGKQ